MHSGWEYMMVRFWITVCLVVFTQARTHGLVLKSGQRLAPSRSHHQHGSDGGGGISPPVSRTSVFDLRAVENWATRNSLCEHHLKSIFKGVNQCQTEDDFVEFITDHGDLPKAHRRSFLESFRLVTCSFSDVKKSSSGRVSTIKLLVNVSSGQAVETVLIRHGDARCTVCVSSQVGCARNCSFCATGTMGLQQNLPAADILQQVWLARGLLDSPGQLRNVVFMGMGEPLDNYDAVYEACRGLTHQRLFGLKCQRVTISTVGAVPNMIRRLAEDAPTISLAVSLHSAVSNVREVLIPSARGINELSSALQHHFSHTGRRVMLEYLLIDGVNDDSEALQALVSFAGSGSYYVNVIPYNPTVAGENKGYKTPSDTSILAFHDGLIKCGVHSRVRWSTSAGRGANGACGQLVVDAKEKMAQ